MEMGFGFAVVGVGLFWGFCCDVVFLLTFLFVIMVVILL